VTAAGTSWTRDSRSGEAERQLGCAERRQATLVLLPWRRMGEGVGTSELCQRRPRALERPSRSRPRCDAHAVPIRSDDPGGLQGTNQSGGSSEMSRVEGFNDNDNVTDSRTTQPFRVLAKPSREATELAATEHQGQRAQSPASGIDPRDRRWPRWPKAWPDDSLPSRSGGAGK
jgi:hypothetical protein